MLKVLYIRDNVPFNVKQKCRHFEINSSSIIFNLNLFSNNMNDFKTCQGVVPQNDLSVMIVVSIYGCDDDSTLNYNLR